MPGVIHQELGNAKIVSGPLIDSTAIDITNAEWQGLDGISPVVVTVAGSFTTATVKLLGSNADTKPTATDNNHPELWSTSIRDSFTIDRPYRWVKATATGIGGGTVAVALFAREVRGATRT